MTPQATVDQRAGTRRPLSWALVAALSVAALTAIGAILSGDFDETDLRVIVSSLGFGVFSATAASGASLRFRESIGLRTLSFATIALSTVSFALLLVAMWSEGDGDVWRWFGSAALAALACSHASLVSGALRSADSPTVQVLALASIALGVADASFGIAVISGAMEEVGEAFGKLVAVLVVLLLLTTALPPILRRLQRSRLAGTPASRAASTAARIGSPSNHPPTRPPLAAEMLAVADRIEALNGDPGNRSPDIRRECERLRELARSYPPLTSAVATRCNDGSGNTATSRAR